MARILICDDDETFSSHLAQGLRAMGDAVSWCVDASQLSIVFNKDEVDVLIVDMQMAGGGGPGVVRFLKERRASDVPVLVISGMPVRRQRPWFAGLRNVRFLQKPIDLDAVRKGIDELIGGRVEVS